MKLQNDVFHKREARNFRRFTFTESGRLHVWIYVKQDVNCIIE